MEIVNRKAKFDYQIITEKNLKKIANQSKK